MRKSPQPTTRSKASEARLRCLVLQSEQLGGRLKGATQDNSPDLNPNQNVWASICASRGQQAGRLQGLSEVL